MNASTNSTGDTSGAETQSANPMRVILGGFFMGLANLVPGVSGGTMILVMGLYERFIGALADLSRMKFSRSAIVFLGLIGVGFVVSVLSLSGVVVSLVTDSRWIMYSLFAGMTLGGAPDLWSRCKPLKGAAIAFFVAALALMAALAWGLAGIQVPETMFVFVCMGMLGASSMILPGISGSYLLLIFGMYEVVIGAVSVSALRADPMGSLRILVPVGLGAVLGMALLSNLLKSWLAKNPATSHAALLGLLLGSVLGLYPFRESVNPELANKPMRKSVMLILSGTELSDINAKYGLDLTAERAAELRESYAGKSGNELKSMGDELKPFDPTAQQIGIALGLIVAGFVFTRALGKRGAH